QAATRVKAERLAWRRTVRLPEHVGACQRGVAAQIDFHRRCEPAQSIAVAFGLKISRLRQVYLCRQLLHPVLATRLVEQADGRRVAGKLLTGKGIDDVQRHRHWRSS